MVVRAKARCQNDRRAQKALSLFYSNQMQKAPARDVPGLFVDLSVLMAAFTLILGLNGLYQWLEVEVHSAVAVFWGQ